MSGLKKENLLDRRDSRAGLSGTSAFSLASARVLLYDMHKRHLQTTIMGSLKKQKT